MLSDRKRKRDAGGSVALVCIGLVLLGLYSRPLTALFSYALSRDLYSHIVLIPFISGYLLFLERARLKETPRTAAPVPSAGFAATSLLAAVAHMIAARTGSLSLNDSLALMSFSLVSALVAAFIQCRGGQAFRIAMFPVLFLYFIVPFPELVERWLEHFFQVTSALCYAGLLMLTRTPFIRDGMVFQLPGLTVQVATECSGIRSSLVLCITGLLGGHMFLKTPWRKAIVSLLFIPIGILRNGLRILTVTLGAIYVDPGIMDGPVHSRGGPPFFVLSLIPLMLILWLMRRREMKATPPHDRNQR